MRHLWEKTRPVAIISHTSRRLLAFMVEVKMADEVRAHPWEQTPLGPIDSRPGELITAFKLMLTSKLISCVVRGPITS